jgi:hypothetical protein
MSDRPVLIVMRLAGMQRRHPGQDNSRFCPHCNHRVGIWPSGQAALKRDARLTILCSVCNDKAGGLSTAMLAPGALHEPGESYDRDDPDAGQHRRDH